MQCIGIKRDMSCHNKSIFHYFLEGYVFFWLNNRQKFTLLFYKREWLSIIWNKVTIGQGLCCGAIRIIVFFCLLKLYLMKIPSHRIYSSLAMCYSDHLCIPCRLCMIANSERHLDKYPQLPRMFLEWQLLLSLVSIPNKNKHCLLIFF